MYNTNSQRYPETNHHSSTLRLSGRREYLSMSPSGTGTLGDTPHGAIVAAATAAASSASPNEATIHHQGGCLLRPSAVPHGSEHHSMLHSLITTETGGSSYGGDMVARAAVAASRCATATNTHHQRAALPFPPQQDGVLGTPTPLMLAASRYNRLQLEANLTRNEYLAALPSVTLPDVTRRAMVAAPPPTAATFTATAHPLLPQVNTQRPLTAGAYLPTVTTRCQEDLSFLPQSNVHLAKEATYPSTATMRCQRGFSLLPQLSSHRAMTAPFPSTDTTDLRVAAAYLSAATPHQHGGFPFRPQSNVWGPTMSRGLLMAREGNKMVSPSPSQNIGQAIGTKNTHMTPGKLGGKSSSSFSSSSSAIVTPTMSFPNGAPDEKDEENGIPSSESSSNDGTGGADDDTLILLEKKRKKANRIKKSLESRMWEFRQEVLSSKKKRISKKPKFFDEVDEMEREAASMFKMKKQKAPKKLASKKPKRKAARTPVPKKTKSTSRTRFVATPVDVDVSPPASLPDCASNLADSDLPVADDDCLVHSSNKGVVATTNAATAYITTHLNRHGRFNEDDNESIHSGGYDSIDVLPISQLKKMKTTVSEDTMPQQDHDAFFFSLSDDENNGMDSSEPCDGGDWSTLGSLSAVKETTANKKKIDQTMEDKDGIHLPSKLVIVPHLLQNQEVSKQLLMAKNQRVYEYPLTWAYSIEERPKLREGMIQLVTLGSSASGAAMIDALPKLASFCLPDGAAVMSTPPLSEIALDDHCPLAYGTTTMFEFNLGYVSNANVKPLSSILCQCYGAIFLAEEDSANVASSVYDGIKSFLSPYQSEFKLVDDDGNDGEGDDFDGVMKFVRYKCIDISQPSPRDPRSDIATRDFQPGNTIWRWQKGS